MFKEKRKNEEKRKQRHAIWHFGIRSRPEKVKRKRGLLSDKSLKTVVEWRLPKQLEKKRKEAQGVMFVAGIWLLLTLYGTDTQIDNWNDWELLDKQGRTQYVPLVETGDHSCGRGDTCYDATYKYRDTEHRQNVDKEKYKRLSNESTVEIIAAGNVSRIAGTHPDFAFTAIVLTVMWSIGFLALLWGVRVLLKIRSMKKYRR